MDMQKAIIEKVYDAINSRDLEIMHYYVAEEYVSQTGQTGVEGFKVTLLPLIDALPDARWVIDHLISEANYVAVSWTFSTTQAYSQTSRTKQSIENSGMAIYTFKGSKIIGLHMLTDRLVFSPQSGQAAPYTNPQTAKTQQVRFIDNFVVPQGAKKTFMKRVHVNRNFIKNLPGFVEDEAYERIDENGNIIYITIAAWENEEALQKAKQAVQKKYQKEGFDPAAFLKDLNITMDRGQYHHSE